MRDRNLVFHLHPFRTLSLQDVEVDQSPVQVALTGALDYTDVPFAEHYAKAVLCIYIGADAVLAVAQVLSVILVIHPPGVFSR